MWLVANKKVNIRDLLQVRPPSKALSLDRYTMCMKNEELINHLFFTLCDDFEAMAQTIQTKET